jgi:hypothetical protein
MKITLDSIVKQIISEAVTPVQFLMKAIKGLGKGAVEGENALIRAIKKEGNLGPKVAVDLNNVSEDLLNKAIKNSEFIAYRKLISQKLYSKNKTIIDDIVSKYKGKQRVLELNNAGIPPSFQEDVRNLSNKGRVNPTTPTNTAQPTTPLSTTLLSSFNSDEDLILYLTKELKYYNLPKIIKGKENQYVREIWAQINEKSGGLINKENTSIEGLVSQLNGLTGSKRELLLTNTSEELLKRNKSYWSTFKQSLSFWNDSEWKSMSYGDKYKKSLNIVKWINLGAIILDTTRYYVDNKNDMEWKGHFGMDGPQTITAKVVAAGIPRVNVLFSTLLAVESAARTVYDVSGLRKKIQGSSVKTNALGDNPPPEDEVDFK